ncbi:Dullard phosphatase domain containing protein, eukaryotic [Tanacetum coccineum]
MATLCMNSNLLPKTTIAKRISKPRKPSSKSYEFLFEYANRNHLLLPTNCYYLVAGDFSTTLLPPNSLNQRTVVLDLDETLIHSTIFRDTSIPITPPVNYDFLVTFGREVAYVKKRPYVDEFLQFLNQNNFEIVIFTAGTKEYASPVLDRLDPYGFISHRLYRDSRKLVNRKYHVKDLSNLGRDLRNVLIVDDKQRSYKLQPENGIPIKRFIDDLHDDELKKLMDCFFKSCDQYEDLKAALKHYRDLNLKLRFKLVNKKVELASGTSVNGADVVKVVTDIAYITDVAPVFHVLTHSQEKRGRTCCNIQKPEVINSSRIYVVRAIVCAPSKSALDKIVLILLRIGFAFVYFEDERDAEDAINALDNTAFGYDRRKLSVEWATVSIMEQIEVVTVDGDGTNDAPTLKEADIGLSMGIQGTEVAKVIVSWNGDRSGTKSRIGIAVRKVPRIRFGGGRFIWDRSDDDIASVSTILMWGRCVHNNIQKFIQFQLMVNVAALVINFIAAVTSGSVPLIVVQLLWVNLIMDTLGALALATE